MPLHRYAGPPGHDPVLRDSSGRLVGHAEPGDVRDFGETPRQDWLPLTGEDSARIAAEEAEAAAAETERAAAEAEAEERAAEPPDPADGPADTPPSPAETGTEED
jgi:hypothetical protein